MSVILVVPPDAEAGGEVVIQSWEAVPPSSVLLPNGQVVVDPKAGDHVDVYEFRAVTAKSPVRGLSFLTRDLLALLSPEDRIAIDRALRARDVDTGDLTATAAALTLLWDGLLGQGDAPISITSDRFVSGWSGLTQALGETRAGEIAAALGIPDSA